MRVVAIVFVTILIWTLLSPTDGNQDETLQKPHRRQRHRRLHLLNPHGKFRRHHKKNPGLAHDGNQHLGGKKHHGLRTGNKSPRLHRFRKHLRKSKRRQNMLPNLNHTIDAMNDNYYFIQSCCMNMKPINQACKHSLDRFHLVCKEHVGAHPGDCKKKANELYHRNCNKKEYNQRRRDSHLFKPDPGRRNILSPQERQNMLRHLNTNKPMEVPMGPHRILW